MLCAGPVSWLSTTAGTQISSSDPPLLAVSTACPSEPFPPFFHPPIELAAWRPCCRLDLDRRIHLTSICFGVLTRLEILHESFEHRFDDVGREPRWTRRISR
jgi:hypothetical protein